MDFFNMNFSTLFLEKHGIKKFNQVNKQIELEMQNKYDNNYYEIIYKIAFLDFFGLQNFQIENLIKHFMNYKSININLIKKVHKKSINQIQNYLQSALDETSLN